MEKQQQLTAGLLFGGVDAHPDGCAVDGLDFLVPQVIQGREWRGLERVQSTLNFIDLLEVCGSRIRQKFERCLLIANATDSFLILYVDVFPCFYPITVCAKCHAEKKPNYRTERAQPEIACREVVGQMPGRGRCGAKWLFMQPF